MLKAFCAVIFLYVFIGTIPLANAQQFLAIAEGTMHCGDYDKKHFAGRPFWFDWGERQIWSQNAEWDDDFILPVLLAEHYFGKIGNRNQRIKIIGLGKKERNDWPWITIDAIAIEGGEFGAPIKQITGHFTEFAFLGDLLTEFACFSVGTFIGYPLND